MTTSEESAERAPHTDQAQGEQSGEAGRKRRRRRRGRNRDKGEGAPQDQAEGQVSDDDGDDDGPDTDTGDGGPASADDAAGGDPERKKKRRRKKKKRGGEGGDEQSAEQDGTAAPAGDAAPQQPAAAPQEKLDKPEKQGRGRRDRDRRGNERSEQPERSEKKEPPSRGNALQRRMSRIEPVKDVYDDDPVIPSAPVPPATTVEGYVSNHRGWQREVLMKLRDIVRTSAPALEESIKWSQPVFEGNGPVCYMKAFSDHVNFGFWRGTELDDPEHLLIGDGIKMRHVRISQVNDVRRELFESFVRQAVRLNIEKGDPTLS
ncbi:MAG: DUF1801 domain-containing protein ['Candidatus Kapabacteria' thiocyanatum]|nr:DUF1801 domain-containing protein ['Candidatus Kapabacteria' thiocyanatum]